MKTDPIPGAAEGMSAEERALSHYTALQELEHSTGETMEFARVMDVLLNFYFDKVDRSKPRVIETNTADMILWLSAKAVAHAKALDGLLLAHLNKAIRAEEGR